MRTEFFSDKLRRFQLKLLEIKPPHNKLLLIIALILVPLPALSWLPKDEIVAHGLILPWPPVKELWNLAVDYLFVWFRIIGFGQVNTEPSGFLNQAYITLASYISGNTHNGQILFLYFGFIGCLAGMIFLARSLNLKTPAALLAGLFYVLHPMVYSGMPVEVVNLRILPFYVITPILFGIFIRSIRYRSGFASLALLGIVSILGGSSAYSSPQYFILHLFLFTGYAAYKIIDSIRKPLYVKQVIFRSAAALLVIFLANFYWLSPLSVNLSGSYAAREEPGLNDEEILKNLSIRFVDSFTSLPYLEQNATLPWAAYYHTPLMKVITFSAVVIAASAFLFLRLKRKALFPGLMLILSMILAKGVAPPHNIIGNVIFLSNPLITRLFRNPTYFEMLIVINLALLVGLVLGELFIIVTEKYRQRLPVVLLAVSGFFFIYGWQFIVGPFKTQPKRNPAQSLEVPPYYYDLARYLQADKSDFRVLSIPTLTRQSEFVAYDWQKLFVGIPPLNVWTGKATIRPYLAGDISKTLEHSMRPDIETTPYHIWNLLLRLTSVRYVVFHNDADWQYLTEQEPSLDQDNSYEFIKNNPSLELKKSFGPLDLYELSDDYYLPHFYISRNMSLLNFGFDELANIAIFFDPNPKSAYYHLDKDQSETAVEPDQIFILGKPENQIDEDYYEKLEAFNSQIIFPTVKHNPESFLYPLVSIKEKFDELSCRNNTEKAVDKLILYASKRISEYEEYGEEMSASTFNRLQTAYKIGMLKVISKAEKLPINNESFIQDLILKIKVNKRAHREKIIGLEFIRDHDSFEASDQWLMWEELFLDIDKRISAMEASYDFQNFEYELNVPKDGSYEILISSNYRINPNNTENPTGLAVFIDDERVVNEHPTQISDWVSLGKTYMTKGYHKAIANLSRSENLVSDTWRTVDEIEYEDQGIGFTSQGFFPGSQNLINQSISKWHGDNLYYLSFEYQTEGGSLGVGVLENKLIDLNDEGKTQKIKIYGRLLRSELSQDQWKKHEAILRSDENSIGAEINFYSLADVNREATTAIKNLIITPIINPKLLIRATDLSKPANHNIPRIAFTRINPTKYKVSVEGMVDSFNLIFLESFHEDWKVYFRDSNYLSPESSGENIANYFGGEIIEQIHRNKFWYSDVFENWSKKPIAEDSHQTVNGYANSWTISPLDVREKNNFDLIVEFSPQKQYYVGLMISVFTFVICLVCLGFNLIKKIDGKSSS